MQTARVLSFVCKVQILAQELLYLLGSSLHTEVNSFEIAAYFKTKKWIQKTEIVMLSFVIATDQ